MRRSGAGFTVLFSDTGWLKVPRLISSPRSRCQRRREALPQNLCLNCGFTGTTIVVDAHRDDGRRFIVRADEKLSAFLEREKQNAKNCSSRRNS